MRLRGRLHARRVYPRRSRSPPTSTSVPTPQPGACLHQEDAPSSPRPRSRPRPGHPAARLPRPCSAPRPGVALALDPGRVEHVRRRSPRALPPGPASGAPGRARAVAGILGRPTKPHFSPRGPDPPQGQVGRRTPHGPAERLSVPARLPRRRRAVLGPAATSSPARTSGRRARVRRGGALAPESGQPDDPHLDHGLQLRNTAQPGVDRDQAEQDISEPGGIWL